MKPGHPAADADWRDAFEAKTRERIVALSPLSGGDVAEAFCVDLASGGRLFVKCYPAPEFTNERAQRTVGPAEAEAYGLAWLASANALPVAQVVAVSRDWLALTWVESAPPAKDYDERLGEGLARLHQATPDQFGLDQANWIGHLPQSNRIEPIPQPDPSDTAESVWARFYGEQRLQPLARRASDAGHLPRELSESLTRLIDHLEELVGPPEPPARLHGDLWAGNVLTNEAGTPCLIDPAVYGGHREIDLAMMRLFGGFTERVFEIYDEIAPLQAGAEARVALYQVYPLLAHVCLFGTSYTDRLSRSVNQALC